MFTVIICYKMEITMDDLSIIDIEKKYIKTTDKEPSGKSAQSVVNKLLSIDDFINKNILNIKRPEKDRIHRLLKLISEKLQ